MGGDATEPTRESGPQAADPTQRVDSKRIGQDSMTLELRGEDIEPTLQPLTDTTLGPAVIQVQPSRIHPVPSSDGPTKPLLPGGGTGRIGLGLRQRLQAEGQTPGEAAPRFSLRAVLLLLLGLFLVVTLGTMAGRQARRLRLARLGDAAREEAAAARARGTPRDYRQAAQALREVLDLDPAHGPSLSGQAYLLTEGAFELGEEDEAAGRAMRLVQTETDEAALAAQVYHALLLGDLREAERRLLHLGALGPGLGDGALLPYLGAQVAWLRGQGEEALRLCEQAARARPERVLWQLRLAELLLASGQQARAAQVLEGVRATHPDHLGAQVLFEEAAGLKDERQRAAAERRLLVLLEAGGGLSALDQIRARLALARLHRLHDDEAGLREARAHLAAAREKLARQAGLWLPQREALAGELLRARESALAQEPAREVLARAAWRRPARLILAQALIDRGQGQDALQVLAPLIGPEPLPVQTSAPSDAEDAEVPLLKARALLGLDQTLEALQVVQEILGKQPRHEQAQLLHARIRLQLGDLPEARQALAGVDPVRQPEARLLLSRILLSERPPQRARARAELEWVVLHGPLLSEARLLLGRLLGEMGHRQEGMEQLAAALRIEDQPAARRELAVQALEAGDASLARQHLDVLLAAAEDNELLLLAARAHRLSGDPAGALQLLSRVRRDRVGASVDAVQAERARAQQALGP
jgi:predicted Zn-dependent protease